MADGGDLGGAGEIVGDREDGAGVGHKGDSGDGREKNKTRCGCAGS
jgi:hypothetical protein